MLIQPTLRRAQSPRSVQRVTFPKIGQCFDIEATRDADGWMIRIPEIGRVTRASRGAAVELAARDCIALWTGIPIGYVSVTIEIG